MKIRPIEIVAYIVTLGWFLMLGRYLITGELDKQLFITASGALGTIAGMMGSSHLAARAKQAEENGDKPEIEAPKPEVPKPVKKAEGDA